MGDQEMPQAPPDQSVVPHELLHLLASDDPIERTLAGDVVSEMIAATAAAPPPPPPPPLPPPPPPPPRTAAPEAFDPADCRALLSAGQVELRALWSRFDPSKELVFVYSTKLMNLLQGLGDGLVVMPNPIPANAKYVFVTTATNRGEPVVEEKTQYLTDVLCKTLDGPASSMTLSTLDLIGVRYANRTWTRVQNLPPAQVAALPKIVESDVLARALDLREGDVLFERPGDFATARAVVCEAPL